MRVVILGGGLAGYCAAEALLEAAPRGVPPEVLILEARQYGLTSLATEEHGGLRIERGHADFDADEPAARALCQRLALQPLAADPNIVAFECFRAGARRTMPRHAIAGMLSRLLLPPHGVREALARAFFGAPNEVIDDAAAALHMQRAARVEVHATTPWQLCAGLLPRHSFVRGMQELGDALRHRIGPRVRTAAAVFELTPLADGWRLSTRQGSERADRVVLATPPEETLRLLESIDGDAAALLEPFATADVIRITLGFQDAPGLRERTRNAGCLIVPSPNVRALDVRVPSTTFASHAASGWICLRLHYGGACDPEVLQLDDTTLLDLARADLRRIYGIDPKPAVVCIDRGTRAWPVRAPQADPTGAVASTLRERWPHLRICNAAAHGGGVCGAIRAAAALISDPL